MSPLWLGGDRLAATGLARAGDRHVLGLGTKGCDCRAAFTLVTFCITGAGLRSDGKKPSLLAQRYPRATSCLGMCEDGLTELGCDRK